jgi:hypothetical protein
MADEQVPVADTPGQLLSATHELTRRVRQAQRATWFPLVLLGLVVVAAVPVYRYGARLAISCVPVSGGVVPVSGGVAERCLVTYGGWPAFIYWMVALVLAYAVIAGFYVLRARRRGVGARIRPYVLAGIAGLILVAVIWPVQQHLGSLQSQSNFQAALVVHGLNPLLAISLALFVLAWAERNGALLAFAVCYLAATLLANYSDVPRRLFEDLGWVPTPQWFFLPTLCLAGGVLLLGGAAFAVAERRRK